MARIFLPVWALILTACQTAMPVGACKPDAQEQSVWSQTSKANTPDAYRSYLAKYPAGCYAPEAANRLKQPVPKVAVGGLVAIDKSDLGSTRTY